MINRYLKWLTGFIFLVGVFIFCKKEIDLKNIYNKYTTEEIEHFIATGFQKDVILFKWEDNLKITISGEYYSEDIRMVEEFILMLDTLAPNLNVCLVDSGGNVEIKFEDHPQGYSGYYRILPFLNGRIYKATVWNAPINKGITRKRVLHHELTHVLGFDDPNNLVYLKGILGIEPAKSFEEYDKWIENYKFPELAKTSIEIMYKESLPPLLRKRRFKRQLKKYREKQAQ